MPLVVAATCVAFSLLHATVLFITAPSGPLSFPLTLLTQSSARRNCLAVSSCNMFLFLTCFHTLPRLSQFPLFPNPFRDRSVFIAEVAADHFLRKTVDNYWTSLSKISWVVRGEQMNYLPKPKAEENKCSSRHWQITIFCDDRVR